jgi:hypothetical protein
MPTLRYYTAVRPLCQRCNRREVDVDDDWVSIFCVFCNNKRGTHSASTLFGAPLTQVALTPTIAPKSAHQTAAVLTCAGDIPAEGLGDAGDRPPMKKRGRSTDV